MILPFCRSGGRVTGTSTRQGPLQADFFVHRASQPLFANPVSLFPGFGGGLLHDMPDDFLWDAVARAAPLVPA